MRAVKEDYCTDKNLNKNYMYPIAGNIGLAKMVDDFFDLSEFTNLGPAADKPKGPPTMVNSLTFTTVLSGSVTPSITLLPSVGTTTGVASLIASASRTDLHKVIVAFARPVETPSEAEAVRVFAGQLINRSGTLTEQRAQLAIAQSIVRYELSNRPTTIILNQSLLPF